MTQISLGDIDVADLFVQNNPVLTSVAVTGRVRRAFGVTNNPQLSTNPINQWPLNTTGATRTVSGNKVP